jgi:two-component system OmpR family response regulator
VTDVRILLVEDDRKLARMLERGLTEAGNQVAAVRDAESGLERLRAGGFDVCVLDVLLPGMDGFAALERARAEGIATPMLMLTARDSVADRVRGLQLGADDYLVKPFAFAELEARLSALARRSAPPRETILRAGSLVLDPAAHTVTLDGRALELSAKQFALLAFLLRHRGRVVTRQMVLEEVFGYEFDPGTNIVDVHVANLRKKIDAPKGASRIETIRGVGYRLEADEPR